MKRLQNADFKTKTDLEAAGSNQSELLNDTKIFVTSLNKQLSQAITDGDLAPPASGGGGKKFFDFKISGNYTGYTSEFDGLFIAPTNIKITGVSCYTRVNGSAGGTTFEIQVKQPSTGSFASIFSTKPILGAGTGNYGTISTGDVAPSGSTTPVLVAAASNIQAKSIFKAYMPSTVSGGTPKDAGIIIFYEEI